MAHFCNQEKEGQQEVERVLSGIGALKRVNVSSHGVLYSGWQPDPESVVQSAPWFGVECCTRGRPIMKAILTDCVAIASMRGAFLPSISPIRWKPARCAALTRHILNGKVSFLLSYPYHVNASGLILF